MNNQFVRSFCAHYSLSLSVEQKLTEYNITSLSQLVTLNQDLLSHANDISLAIETELLHSHISGFETDHSYVSVSSVSNTPEDILTLAVDLSQLSADGNSDTSSLGLCTHPNDNMAETIYNAIQADQIPHEQWQMSPDSLTTLNIYGCQASADNRNPVGSAYFEPLLSQSASASTSATPDQFRYEYDPSAMDLFDISSPSPSPPESPANNNFAPGTDLSLLDEFVNSVKAECPSHKSLSLINEAFLSIVPAYRKKTEDGKSVCKICEETFKRADHLTTHLARHAKLKRYECDFCAKRFLRADESTRHQKKHCHHKLLAN